MVVVVVVVVAAAGEDDATGQDGDGGDRGASTAQIYWEPRPVAWGLLHRKRASCFRLLSFYVR